MSRKNSKILKPDIDNQIVEYKSASKGTHAMNVNPKFQE